MSEIKRYEVAIDYKARDNASPALNGIERAAQRSSKSTGALTKSLVGFGAAIAGSRALGAAKSAFISFNAGLEDSRVIMAGMLQMNIGGNIENNMARATKSVERFQQMAKASALTTKDLVGMAQMIEGPLLQAGAGMRQIENLTFGAANAAKAFQIPAEMAALDIQQAINGTLSSKDRFAKSILSQKGINMSAEKFNDLSASERLATLNKAFSSDAIKQMAKAQSETFSGVVSTLQDNLEMLAGRVGLPLFKAISKEVKGWNDWIERNQRSIEKFAQSFASGLVTAFNALRDGVGFIVRHADKLLLIGKVWAAAKIANVAGGLLGGKDGKGGLPGLLSSLTEGWGRMNTKVGMRSITDGRDAGGRYIAGMSRGENQVGVVGAIQSSAMAGFLGWEIGKWATENIGPVRELQNVLNEGLFDLPGIERGGMRLLRANMAKISEIEKWDARLTDLTAEAKQQAVADNKYGALATMAQYAKNDRKALAYEEQMERLRGQLASHQGLINANAEEKNLLQDKLRASEKQQKIGSLFSKEFGDAQQRLIELEQQTKNATLAIEREKAEYMKAAWPAILGEGLLSLKADFFDPLAQAWEFAAFKEPKKKDTNIHIAKVEVAAKDPDRWISDLDAKVNKQIKAPKAAKRALRGAL